jgi:O-antigen ligase
VIAAAAVAQIWRELRAPAPRDAAAPSLLEIALAAFVALYALQSLYSNDFANALEQMAFFYVPFALLLKLLSEVRWTRSLLVACAGMLLALALVFSAIGFWEYHRRELFWNPKVISGNQFQSYFRVNSVFWDPNIYGRFLVLVMLVVTAVVLWSGRVRTSLAAAAALAVLWGGLVLTFSQSSLVALLAGLVVLAALRWDPRRTAALTAIAAALGGVIVVAFQDTLRLHLGSSSGLRKATSGRSDLIEGGARLFADRPLWGWGSGAFARTYRTERKGSRQQAVSASHTLPLTVAAEQGLAGLALYVLVLAAAFRALLARTGAATARAPPGERDDGAGAHDPARAVARAALTAAFTALLVHTMMYAAFLEDPFTWVILGVAIGVLHRVPSLADAAEVARPRARPAAAVA